MFAISLPVDITAVLIFFFTSMLLYPNPASMAISFGSKNFLYNILSPDFLLLPLFIILLDISFFVKLIIVFPFSFFSSVHSTL